MSKSGTLAKTHIVESVAEANGFSRRKSVEAIETLLELINYTLESGEDVLISDFGRFCVKKKPNDAAAQEPGYRKRYDVGTKKSRHIQMVRETILSMFCRVRSISK